jgi:hypothetical protein
MLFPFLVALSGGVFRHGERIGHDMRTKVYLISPDAKILWIPHFSEHS